MISSSPQSLNTRSGFARFNQRASSRTRPGISGGFQFQGVALPTQRQAVARAQGDEGVPGEAQGKGGQGWHDKLQRKRVLLGLKVEQRARLRPPPHTRRRANSLRA